MNKKGLIIRDLAKKYNKDIRVTQQIVDSLFKFVNRVVTDPCDRRPVRLRYFGVFMEKEKSNKDMKAKYVAKLLLDDIQNVLVVMASILGYDIDKAISAKAIIERALEEKDYEKLTDIYGAYKEWNK